MTEAARRCIFCHMRTTLRFARLPMCPICRDQSYDFLWASGIQALFVAAGLIGGLTFLAEEAALFVGLVLVKHRVPPPWGRPGGASPC